jgi:DNA invertase Pin-like site-specific DNA recombinase
LTKRQSNEGSNPCNERTRERIRAVKRHMAMEGLYGGGKPPFGFDVVEDKLVPNPNEQATIERMKTMRRDGATYRKIGEAVGKDPTVVQRILTRLTKAPGTIDDWSSGTAMPSGDE